MKPALLAACLLAAGPAAAELAAYGIDPTHTFASFEVLHQGLSTLRGRFDRKDGSIGFDRAGRDARVDITVDVKSVNTGVPALDRLLRGAAWFNSEEFPTARFVGERVVFEGDKLAEVAGTLTLAGRTAPLTLRASRFNCYFSPLFRREVCGGDFEALLQRSRWGIGDGQAAPAADAVRLRVQVEAVRQ